MAIDATNRSKGWLGIGVLSIIILITFADQLQGQFDSNKSKFIVACCSFGIIFGTILTVSSYFEFVKKKLIGSFVEAALAIINLTFWSIGVGILQSPKNGFANQGTDGQENIKNANLYFASWVLFAMSVSVCASILQDLGLLNMSNSMSRVSKSMMRWFLLLAVSLVVLVTSALLKSSERRALFSIAVGAINTILAFIITAFAFFKCPLGVKIQLAMSIVSVTLYCFGVAYITSPSGPAPSVSNLYFSAWIGFIVSINLFMNLVDDFTNKAADGTSSSDIKEESVEIQEPKDDKSKKDEEDPQPEDVDL